MEHRNDLLRGTVVWIHPSLKVDPLYKKNHIGVICEANLELDDIYVDFVDKIGLYSADSLYTFLPTNEVSHSLDELPNETDFENLKALTQIHIFLQYGDVNGRIKAMRIARDHPLIQPLCLGILEEQLSKNIINSYGR